MSTLTETPLQSDQLVDGALLKVYRDTVQLPDESTGVREWIDHPGASAVVPLFEDGSVLLIEQFRYPPRRTFLEVPAGKIDQPDEDPAEVAARELEEETGWRAGAFTKLSSLYPCIGYSNEIIHFFLAHDLTKGTQDLSEGEHVEVVRLPFRQAVKRARRGEIKDMKSAMALTLAQQFLHAGA
jgi:ADP-ribose pyrophosphatase